MRNLNLDQVQTLIAIADLGTFAAAAQALHLAPPTISLHVKELESRMQTHLVARGRRQAELTPAGRALVQEGRKLLAASDDLIDVVRLRAAGGDGLVKVGVSAGVGMQRLPLMLDALRRRNPRVELKLEAVGSAEAMQRLQAATLDVGIVASPQPAVARVALMPWRNDPMVALVPASWEAPETVTPEWLSTRRWASFAPGTQMHGLIAAWFGQAGFNPRPFLTLSYPGALKALATANQSAAILPLDEVDDQQRTPEVLIRPLSPPLMRPMAVAYRSSPTPNEAMTAVLEVLAEFST
ncbi:MAG: LysR family transcriptional regulator [Achromobacter sp.]|uniref:LysR family transcriptional regulator n=1 Tax=Achromobacter sp. TaxID=134375 RepID=UPI003CFE782E